jgi:serine protease Do
MRKLAVACVAALAFSFPTFAQSPQQPATRESQALPSIAPLVESVKSAVVNIDVQTRGGAKRQMGQGPGQGQEEDEEQMDLFEHFFGGPRGGRGGGAKDRIQQGMGSGFIIDPKGLVVTNNHVVEGAVAIRVRLDDGRAFDGQILGRDPLTDVALVKLKGKVENLPSVKLGDSNAMKVGDWVVAIGNPLGLASSVSLGIISARARDLHNTQYDDFLQTDAAITFGNSGGPLFNMKGEVIGINTAIAGLGTGIGFAVSSNVAKALVPQLEMEGAVTRGWRGIGIQDLTPDIARGLGVPVNEGAIVTSVNQGSPAKKAGLQEDDVVVTLDGDKIVSGGSLTRIVALKRPDSTVTMAIFRAGKPHEVKVTLGTRPDLEGLGIKNSPRDEDVSKEDRLGFDVRDMDPRLAQGSGLPAQGALITEVAPGSPAERADLRRGMVVIEADKKPVRNANELLKAIKATKPGNTLLLRVQTPGGGARFLKALPIPG